LTTAMKFDWKRPLSPILLVAGLLICILQGEEMHGAVTGVSLFLISFALILGFSRGSS